MKLKNIRSKYPVFPINACVLYIFTAFLYVVRLRYHTQDIQYSKQTIFLIITTVGNIIIIEFIIIFIMVLHFFFTLPIGIIITVNCLLL